MSGRPLHLPVRDAAEGAEHLAPRTEEAGADAFPIVSLISLLIGMIFAFVGVMQLNMFGAGIFTANLVAKENKASVAARKRFGVKFQGIRFIKLPFADPIPIGRRFVVGAVVSDQPPARP